MDKTPKYPLASDTIDKNDILEYTKWLLSMPRMTMDVLTKQYEKEWANHLGRKYAIFCNSGSSANLLMYYALLCSSKLMNKKVIVPSTGWVTSVAPAIQLGFEPIMCESDGDTFGLDLEHLEELIKKNNPASVMMVQALGVPHKMNELLALQEKYGFFLLEDACAAVGSSYKGKKLGTFGDMSSFSTYYGHQSPTVEGGLVFTDDQEFYNLSVMLRSHGWGQHLDPETYDRIFGKYNISTAHRPFAFFYPGFNVRPTDMQAFLGLGQLRKLDWTIQRRSENHELYRALLGPHLRVQKYPTDDVIVCSISFAILAENSEQRDRIANALEENSIEKRFYSAGNLGLHPFWYDHYGKFQAPMATRIYDCGLFLPNNPNLVAKDIEFISSVVLKSLGRA